MALHKMLISQKDEFTVDLDKAYLVEESKDLICTQYDVKLTFGGKVHLDQKQWIEIQGMRANCSQAKDYICALCNPAEMAELIYPVELEEVIKDSELRCRVEKQSSVALCYEESGKVSIQGNDPVSVTTAYSMLEDIISQHWDKTKENTSRKPKQASRKLDAKLKRLNSVNKLDVSDETPSLSNTIKHVILDVLKTNKDTSCSDSLEDYGIRIHHGRQIKQIDSKGTSKGKSEVINDPGKYLKEYALEKGYSEDKVESIFAAYGRDVKFDIFFRALNDMIKVPQDKRTSVVKSAENISDTQDIGDTSSSSAGLTVSDNMAVECSEEKEIILNVSTLKKRNMKRQQLLEADNVCSAPKGISLLDQVQTEGEIDSTFASAGSSQKPVTIDLTGDDSQDETYDSSNHEGTRSLGKIVDNFYLTEQTIVQKANAATNAATLSRLRHIVIDGSNVAMAHGNHKVFSCRGIEIVVNYFLRRGHKQVTAFVPQWRKCATSVDHISDQHLLDELQRAGHLVFTPSRKIQGKQIVCYDDRYVVKLAQEVDGVIVSNDNYRDLWYERPDWRHVIENRLLMYSFVGDLFMPPDDPLGRNGPSLDEFLRKPITNTETKQNRHSTSQILPGQPSHPPSLHPGQMFRTAPLGIPSLMNIPQFPHQLQGPPSWNNVIVGRGKLPAAPQSADQGAQRCLEMADFGHSNSTNNTTVYKSRSAARQSQHHQERAGEWRQIMPKRRQTFLCKGKPREEAITRQLYRSMKEVFTDHDDAIQHVLEDNPMEEDLNTLSEYLLNYLSSN